MVFYDQNRNPIAFSYSKQLTASLF